MADRITMNFDEVDEIVYIADIETYELLYINRFGIRQLTAGGSEELLGRPCYQVFQELDAPCVFCCLASLTDKTFHEWEYTNSLKKCNYKILEKLLHYQGRRAVLRLAIQITGDNRKNQQLEGNPSIDEICLEWAKKLQDMEDERQALAEALATLGTRLQGDRVFIYEIHGKLMSNTYEWCRAGIASRKKACPIRRGRR